MFLDKVRGIVVGFEINKEYSQISFCTLEQSMPDTLSLVNGQEEYNIPTAIRGKYVTLADNTYDLVWSVGRDIRNNKSDDSSFLIDNILDLVEKQSTTVIGNKELSADQLLKNYIKRCLSILIASGRNEDIVGICFTSNDMSEALMAAIRNNFSEIPVYFVNKQECFYQYMLHQPQEMWVHDCLLFDMDESGLTSYCLEHNPITKPIVSVIEEKKYNEIYKMTDMSEQQKDDFDIAFKNIVAKLTTDRIVTSTFLIGDGFSKEWCKDSLKEICRHSRAFGGNNLYSKGACYYAREKVMPSTLSTDYVFLGKDKLKSNVGMYVTARGEEKYLPLLHAGTTWYEAKYEGEFILMYDNKLRINITSLTGATEKTADISLDYFQIRNNKTNRIAFKIEMKSKDVAHIEIRDLGFGDIFPAKNVLWQDNIIVS